MGGGAKRKFKDCMEEDLKMTDAETDFCGKRRSPCDCEKGSVIQHEAERGRRDFKF